MAVRVGTSGWQYADWRERFYPRGLAQRDWLARYADEFDTVEVNATFYRLPRVEVVARWAQIVPPGFVVTVKASRYLSHIKRLREPEEPVQRLLDRVAPLRERGVLGPVLLQLPPDFAGAPDLLAATLDRFPSDVRVAVEPREVSWFSAQTERVLADHDAALVWADRDAREVTPLWETASWRYLRLHHGARDWSYDDPDLRRWVGPMAGCADGYVYFNNDPGGAAIRDAVRFREMLAGAQRQPQPADSARR